MSLLVMRLQSRMKQANYVVVVKRGGSGVERGELLTGMVKMVVVKGKMLAQMYCLVTVALWQMVEMGGSKRLISSLWRIAGLK